LVVIEYTVWAEKSWATDSGPLFCQIVTDLRKLTLRFLGKFVVKRILKIPPHLAQKGDVEPDDIAPVAAIQTISDTRSATHIPLVGSVDASVLEAESMSTESAGSVSVPAIPIPEGQPLLEGGHGVGGPQDSSRVTVTL